MLLLRTKRLIEVTEEIRFKWITGITNVGCHDGKQWNSKMGNNELLNVLCNLLASSSNFLLFVICQCCFIPAGRRATDNWYCNHCIRQVIVTMSFSNRTPKDLRALTYHHWHLWQQKPHLGNAILTVLHKQPTYVVDANDEQTYAAWRLETHHRHNITTTLLNWLMHFNSRKVPLPNTSANKLRITWRRLTYIRWACMFN